MSPVKSTCTGPGSHRRGSATGFPHRAPCALWRNHASAPHEVARRRTSVSAGCASAAVRTAVAVDEVQRVPALPVADRGVDAEEAVAAVEDVVAVLRAVHVCAEQHVRVPARADTDVLTHHVPGAGAAGADRGD